jgi:hypothetical protein
MPAEPNILVFASTQNEGDRTAKRLRSLGFRPLVAKTFDAAQAIVADPRFDVGAAILSVSAPGVALADALGDLRTRCASENLGFVVHGERPDRDGIALLQAAGIQLVAWEPCPDAVLRFQLNRALGEEAHAKERAAERVPVARRVRIVSGRFSKAAAIYTLSSGGAFVETPRPSLRGARVVMELVLPRGDVTVEGEVVYTNVPGNLFRGAMPLGMGVRFGELSPEASTEIAHCVREAAEAIALEPSRVSKRGGLRRLWRRSRD